MHFQTYPTLSIFLIQCPRLQAFQIHSVSLKVSTKQLTTFKNRAYKTQVTFLANHLLSLWLLGEETLK